MSVGLPITYSCNDVLQTLGGYILDGFGPTDIVSTEAGRETVKHVEGADGQITRVVRRALPLQKVTIRLAQTSAANRILSLEHDLQRIPGYVPKPYLLQNLGNGEKLFIGAASILGKPGVNYGVEDQVREWVIEGQGDSQLTGG
jgi:hypothetical protein